MADVVEVYSDEATIVVHKPVTKVVRVVSEGPQGPPGVGADEQTLITLVDVAVQDYFVLHPQSFVYDQNTAVYHWDIVHPLDHRPEVTVTDSAGTEIEGEVNWPASNRVTIDFNTPLAGRATLT